VTTYLIAAPRRCRLAGQLGAGVVNLRLHRLRLGTARLRDSHTSGAIGSTEMATAVTMANSRLAPMSSTWPRK
jgi:hypothetical protein